MSAKINIGIIGSGAMGSGIAQVAAQSGHFVSIYDTNESALEKSKQNLNSTFNKLTEKGKISAEDAKKYFGSINFCSSLNDEKLISSQLIIEAIVENLDIKQKVFSEIESKVSSDCILASNTSSLSITSIASSCRKPERVIGIHFFNPAPLMPLVEIIPGIATSNKVTALAQSVISEMGKSVVLCKDTPGFIVNRIARPYYGEAMRIYEEGIADIATIDHALKSIGGFKMGPFELTDLIGHDVNYTVTETVWRQFYFDGRYKPALCQKRLVEAKMFGRKSGKGFYDYTEGAISSIPTDDKILHEQIFLRVISMLVNEAVDALYLNVASAKDIDTAMMKGVNYPKGLLSWGNEIGLDKILNTLDELYDLYKEERYRASVLLRKHAKENTPFY
jgi:3-hydroxybutyryl-CoA dehydrogenase